MVHRTPQTIPPETVGSPVNPQRPSSEQPRPPSKAAPVAVRLDMDEAFEETQAEHPRKRHYDQDADLEPSCKRGRISPTASPEQEPPPMELPPVQKEKAPVCRSVSFESQDQEMPDQQPACAKAPCETCAKNVKLEFEGGCDLNDSDFAFLMCDETLGEPFVVVKPEPSPSPSRSPEPLTQPEPVVKSSAKSAPRLIDSAKKFANEDKTPLKGSNLFNTAELVRSASHCLADILNTPPTTKRAHVDKKTPSSSKGRCSMSQADVFGEDTSSDSDKEDK